MSHDKLLHLAVGSAVYILLTSLGLRRSPTIVAVLMVAMGKEAYDLINYGGAGMIEAGKDILATTIIPILGYVISSIRVRL